MLETLPKSPPEAAHTLFGNQESLPPAHEISSVINQRLVSAYAEMPVKPQALDVTDVMKRGRFDPTSNMNFVTIDLQEQEAPPQPTDVINAFVAQTAEKLSRNTWWEDAKAHLERKGMDKDVAEDALSLRTAHRFPVTTPYGIQGEYELLECGASNEAQLTQEEMDGIQLALQAVDQFSGGALSYDPNLSRIITTYIDMPHPLRPSENIGGLANRFGTVLNMYEVRRSAKEHNVDISVMTAVILVHELLGHQLERMTNTIGVTGTVFPKHFRYSKRKESGELFSEVHESIEPKEAKRVGSKPVREYGRVNPSEDYATATDAMVGAAMGWQNQVGRSKRMASEPDAYRTDIVLDVMDVVAKKAQKLRNQEMTGSGSPIEYSFDDENNVSVEPGRKLLHEAMAREDVIAREIEVITERYRNPNPIYYRLRRPEEFEW